MVDARLRDTVHQRRGRNVLIHLKVIYRRHEHGGRIADVRSRRGQLLQWPQGVAVSPTGNRAYIATRVAWPSVRPRHGAIPTLSPHKHRVPNWRIRSESGSPDGDEGLRLPRLRATSCTRSTLRRTRWLGDDPGPLAVRGARRLAGRDARVHGNPFGNSVSTIDTATNAVIVEACRFRTAPWYVESAGHRHHAPDGARLYVTKTNTYEITSSIRRRTPSSPASTRRTGRRAPRSTRWHPDLPWATATPT